MRLDIFTVTMFNGNIKMLESLLKHTPKIINIPCSDTLYPLCNALLQSPKPNMDIVLFLLKNGANIDNESKQLIIPNKSSIYEEYNSRHNLASVKDYLRGFVKEIKSVYSSQEYKEIRHMYDSIYNVIEQADDFKKDYDSLASKHTTRMAQVDDVSLTTGFSQIVEKCKNHAKVTRGKDKPVYTTYVTKYNNSPFKKFKAAIASIKLAQKDSFSSLEGNVHSLDEESLTNYTPLKRIEEISNDKTISFVDARGILESYNKIQCEFARNK